MKQKHILWSMLALFAVSCTNDEINEVVEVKQNGIQVAADFGTDTRIDFSDEGNVTHVLWNESDQITIYDEAQGGLDYQVASVSNDGATANFTAIGAGLQETAEGVDVNAIYPALPVENGIVKLPNTNVWNEDRLIPYATAVGSINDSKLHLFFFHDFAYLKLTLNAETVANSDVKTIHAVYLQTTDVWLASEDATYDLKEETLDLSRCSNNSMLFNLNEPFTATGDAEKVIYIPILPQRAGETLTLSILHHDDYGMCDTLLTVSKKVPEPGFFTGNVITYTPKYKQTFTRDENNTITVFEPGVLSQAITEEEKYALTSLKIIGPLNGDDIRFIIEMAGRDINEKVTKGKLDHLDISEASIVEGGGMYFVDYDGNQHYTSNDVIGDCMFWRCCLKTLILPNNVTSIGDFAFYDSSSLSSITIPDGVTSIGKEAFLNCIALSSIVIPDALATIGNSAFSVCTALTSIVIPDGVTSIGEKAFFSCEALTSVNIPDAVTSIGKSAFIGCEGLASVNISDLSAWCKIEFGDVSANPLSSCATAKLYLNGKELTDVIIPNNITQIKNFTFGGYDALTSITIPTGVTLIGDGAFNGCSSLSTITIPEGVTTIGDSAFQNCTSLSDIVIPNSVINIKDFAFYSCSSLADVTCNALTPPILGGLSFESIASPSTLIVPADCVTAYSESDWAQYFTTIEEATR